MKMYDPSLSYLAQAISSVHERLLSWFVGFRAVYLGIC